MPMNTPTPNVTLNDRILTLVTLAQKGPTAPLRRKATDALWELCGDSILVTTTKNSITVDADHDLHGKTFDERQNHLAGDIYTKLFCKCVHDFDGSMGVPFLAFCNQRSKWFAMDMKRKNAIRCATVQLPTTEANGEIFENTATSAFSDQEASFDLAIERKLQIEAFRKALKHEPKKLQLFDAMFDVCKSHNYTDAETAKKLHCSRANVGQIRKQLRDFLAKNGLE